LNRLALAVAIAAVVIVALIGYLALTHWLPTHPTTPPKGSQSLDPRIEACRYSFVRHLSAVVAMSYLGYEEMSESEVSKAIALSLANGLLTPCLLSPYDYPAKPLRIVGSISVRSIEVKGSSIELGNFTQLPMNFSIRSSGSSVITTVSISRPRPITSSIVTTFYTPPLVASEVSNVTTYLGSIAVSRVSEYGYGKNQVIERYCAYAYLPQSGRSSGKQCLVIDEKGALLVNSSKRIGSSDLYRMLIAIPKSVSAKRVNSSALELKVSYIARSRGFEIRIEADEVVKFVDAGGVAIMTGCFVKEMSVEVSIGNSTYSLHLENQPLMMGSVRVLESGK